MPKYTVNSKAFTLVELMVVITIIAILTAVGATIYSSVNMRGRDAVRIADLANIQQALLISTHDKENTSSILCHNLTTPCEGLSFPKDNNTKNTDGTGWIKVNLDTDSTISFNSLAIDPKNNSNYLYRYYSDGTNWKIEATLESNEYRHLMIDDGGLNDDKYEIGIKIKLLP